MPCFQSREISMANLGAAIVEIRGNLAPLNATLDAARSHSASFTAQTEQQMERVAGSLGKIRTASASASASFDKLVADAKRSGASLASALDQGFNVGKISASARASADAFVSEFKRIEAAADHAAGAWQRLGAAGSANLNAIRTNRTLSEQNAEAARRLGALGSTGSNVIPFQRPATRDKRALQDSTMIGAQLSDFGVQVASGQGWLMPLIQQGSQLQFQLGDRGLKGAVKSLGSGLLDLATNPLTLTIAGLAAAGVAAQYFWDKANSGIENTEQSFERHIQTLARMKGIYGEIANAATPSTSVAQSMSALQADAASTRYNLSLGGRKLAPDLFTPGDPFGNSSPVDTYKFPQLSSAIDEFQKSVLDNAPDFNALREAAAAVYNSNAGDPAFEKMWKDIDKATEEGSKLQNQLEQINRLLKEPAWMARHRVEAFGADLLSQRENERAAEAIKQRYSAEDSRFDIQSIGARSPQERARIAGAQARAQAMRDEFTAPYADQAAQQASARVMAQAAREAKDYTAGQIEGARQRIEAATQEIRSIGQTATESDRLRIVMERTNEARQRAYQLTGDYNAVSAQTIEEINREAGALAALGEAARRAGLARDVLFDRQQLGRSESEREIYSRMNSAGLLDQDGEISGAMNQRIADQMRWNQTIEDTQRAFRGLGSEIVESLGKGDLKGAGKAILGRFQKLVADQTGQLIDDGINSLISNVMGPGAASALGLGGKPDGSAARPYFVVPTGAAGGLPDMLAKGLGGGGDVSRGPVGLVANDNGVASLALTRGVPQAGMTGGGVPALGGFNLAAAAQAIKDIESSGGNYGALGPVTKSGDRAYGAYQVMGSNIGPWSERYLGQRLTPQAFLADRTAQDTVFQGEFGRLANRYGPEGASRAWFAGEGGMRRMGATDVVGTSVGGYGGRFGQLYSKYTNENGMAPQFSEATKNLTDFNTKVADSTGSLGTFGQGLGSFGQALGGAAGGGMGAGGGDVMGGLLGGIFGIAGKIFGFDEGGYTGPGGKKQAAGIVHKGEVVFSQSDVARAGGVGAVEGIRRSGGTLRPVVAAPKQAAPVSFRGGDVIVQGNADQTTLAEMRKAMAENNKAMLEHMKYQRENEWRAA